MANVPEYFGSDVFNESVMKERLPKATYKALKKTIDNGDPLDIEVANIVANAIRGRTGAELRTQGGQIRPFLTEQEQVQFFSQLIQPPQPAAARTGKSVFHRTMEFLGRDQRHHGLTAGRVKFCAG